MSTVLQSKSRYFFRVACGMEEEEGEGEGEGEEEGEGGEEGGRTIVVNAAVMSMRRG